MLTTDRDLLILEPNLLRDLAWLGRRVLSDFAAITGVDLALTKPLPDTPSVAPGQIALWDQIPVEIIAVAPPSTLTVSLVRTSTAYDPIAPTAVPDGVLNVYTFAPQIALIRRQLLRMIGLTPANTPAAQRDPADLDDSALTNHADLVLLEALGVLHLLYAQAAGSAGPGSPAAARAADYRARFTAERIRAAALIDLDGDALPDAARRFTSMHLVRG